MAHLLKKPQITVLAKEGECEIHISLDLNINLNTNGVKAEIIQEKKEEDIPFYAIPDFKMEKVKFGERI